MKEVETSRDEEKKRGDVLDVEVGNHRQTQKDALAENESLKAEVQKDVEEIASKLGEGYSRCLE